MPKSTPALVNEASPIRFSLGVHYFLQQYA